MIHTSASWAAAPGGNQYYFKDINRVFFEDHDISYAVIAVDIDNIKLSLNN
jgi:hypothetical protein